MRILAVSDSDSYLKWSHALLARAAGHEIHEVVLGNVLSPSATQIVAATGRSLERLNLPAVVRRVRSMRPDAVVVACTGPALEVVVNGLHAAGLLGANAPGRPLLVSGFPGVTVPANELALRFRRHLDLVIVASRRELVEHQALGTALGVQTRFALATLPFLDATPVPGGRDIVFAAQSLVPAGVAERRRVLTALASVPDWAHPVVKVRAMNGERQAHNERWPYATLSPDPRITFRAGAMRDSLESAAGFATVSSTAVLEAIAAGVPSLVLGDFGVNDAMITTVFDGSGLIGSLDDLAAGRFRTPNAAWLRDNYFHDPGEDTWLSELAELAAAPREPIDIEPFGTPAARLRRWVRLAARPGLDRRRPAPHRRRRGRR